LRFGLVLRNFVAGVIIVLLMNRSTLLARLPHLLTLVLGAIFGGSLVFITPPFGVPDELAHFNRIYHCSQGKVYACRRDSQCGDDLPASLNAIYQAIAGDARQDEEFCVSRDKIRQALAIPLDPAQQQYSTFENTALYSPVPYLPAAAAVGIGRVAEMRPLGLLYLGRIANLIAYLALAVAAVRLIPVQKWTLALVALMPMSMFLAASLSADAVTLGLALMTIALALDLALGEEAPAGRLAAFGLCLVLLALSKQAYVSLALLFFIIPAGKFAGRGQWLTAAVLFLGLPLAANLAWAYSVRSLYVPMLPFVDPPQQIAWIGLHPWSYAAAMFKAVYHLDTYLGMIGLFGWLGAHLSKTVCLVYWMTLAATAFLDGGKPLPLAARTRAILLGIYVTAASVVSTIVYLSWERVGIKSIEGIQPRYFLPLLPLVLLPFRGSSKLVSHRFLRLAVPLLAMLGAMVAAAATWKTMAMRYYW